MLRTSALDASYQGSRKRAVQFDLDAGERLSKNFQYRGQHERRIQIGRAEDDMSLDIELRQQFIVEPQDRPGKFENRLAFRGEKEATALVNEDGFSRQLLEALQLERDRRLSSAQSPRRFRNASGLDNRNQRAKHPYVQADQVH